MWLVLLRVSDVISWVANLTSIIITIIIIIIIIIVGKTDRNSN